MALYIGQAIGSYKGDAFTWDSNSDSGKSIFTIEADGDVVVGSEDGKFKIYQIGIQSLPGVAFQINDNMTDANSTIRIGQTGIFELNLADATPITKLTFTNLGVLQNSDTNYLIIDVIFSVNSSSSEEEDSGNQGDSNDQENQEGETV